jgi:hypothetical protein
LATSAVIVDLITILDFRDYSGEYPIYLFLSRHFIGKEETVATVASLLQEKGAKKGAKVGQKCGRFSMWADTSPPPLLPIFCQRDPKSLCKVRLSAGGRLFRTKNLTCALRPTFDTFPLKRAKMPKNAKFTRPKKLSKTA